MSKSSIEKTKLMEQFEKETGKKAIWSGKITKQFEKWKISHKEVEMPLIREEIGFEVVLFLALSRMRNPTFTKILEFGSSFGMMSNEIIKIIIKKIKEGDLSYELAENSELKNIYTVLFKLKNLELPLTIKVIEALDMFNNINFGSPIDAVNFFSNLQKKYPNFVVLSSSRLDKHEDLITFKRLFPDQIIFKLSSRWAI